MGLAASRRRALGMQQSSSSSSWVGALEAADGRRRRRRRVPSGMDAMEAKGDNLVDRARRQLHGFWAHVEPAKDRQRYAARYFADAAEAFTLAKSWRKAAFSHHEAAICHMKIGREERVDAAHSLWEAAKCYKKAFDPDDKEIVSRMEWVLKTLVRILVLENEMSVAGSACEELAELYAARKRKDEAKEFYGKAAEYYGMTTDPFRSTFCRQSALDKAASYL